MLKKTLWILMVVLVTFACQFPGNLIANLTQDQNTPTSTRNIILLEESPEVTEPGTGSKQPLQTEPSSVGQTPAPATESIEEPYPVPFSGSTSTTILATPYPQAETPPGTFAATSTFAQVNASTTPGSPTPSSTQTSMLAVTFTPTSSGTVTILPSFTPSLTTSGTVTLIPSSTATATPTSTGSFVHSATSTKTATPTLFIFPSATPFGSQASYRTPTPTLTRTPTITPTPLPPPPWVSSQLRASDPQKVNLSSGKVQLIEFFAFWSGPSQAMAPIVFGIEEVYRNRMNFIYLDIDDPANKNFISELGFRMEPHFFLVDKDGRILNQWLGYVRVDHLLEAINRALKQ